MKKPISIFLILVYTFLTVGISVSKHFCGEFLAEITVFSSEKKTCKCSLFTKKGEKSNCCKDEVKVVKLETSQNLTKIASFDFLKVIDAFISSPFPFSFPKSIFSISLISWKIESFFPPPKSSLYLLFCVFRV
jgi:hypothetical protein